MVTQYLATIPEKELRTPTCVWVQELREIVQSDPHGRAERWLAENDEALRSPNDFVERHGLPLARHRRF